MPKVSPTIVTSAKIKVIGVGGAGKNAVNHMIQCKVEDIDFISVNTDTQDLHHSMAPVKIHIGKNYTKGLGAGMDPEKGQRAAEETKEEIHEAIQGADMVFITAGMGGGTGTGASPIVARTAKEQDILTVAVVTRPFFFEGRERARLAEKGLAELEKEVDAMIVIPNDRILATVDQKTSFKNAFAMCDEVLRQAVEGIANLVTTSGTIGNIDFADIKTILKNSGTALMGVGIASGEGAAVEAVKKAINSPLLDISIHGAKGVLLAFAGNSELSLWDVQEAAKIVHEAVDKDARIIFGTTINESSKNDEVKVTVIATGFPNPHRYGEVAKKDTGTVITNTKNFINRETEKVREREVVKEKEEVHTTASSLRSFFGGSKKDFDEEIEEEKEELKVKQVDTINRKEDKEEHKKEEKKAEKKVEKEVEIVETIDDSDDWGSVPAFMRRK
jgi:cell division protein FtsZ